MNLLRYPLMVLRDLLFKFQWKGTAGRKECWTAAGMAVFLLFTLWLIGIGICCIVEPLMGWDTTFTLEMAWGWLLFIPLLYYLCVKLILLAARRCRDMQVSPWWAVVVLVPLFAHPFLTLLVFVPVFLLFALSPGVKPVARRPNTFELRKKACFTRDSGVK